MMERLKKKPFHFPLSSRAVVFLLLVLMSSISKSVVVVAAAGMECPSQCKCPEDRNTTIDCSSGAVLTVPPRRISGDVVFLDLSHNALGPIINDTFPKLGNLKELDLSYNGLVRLLGCTLQGMLGLKRISLRGNRLTSLPDSLFTDANGLEHLDISHNILVTMPDHVFRNVPGLKYLDLSYNRMEDLTFGLALQAPRHLTTIDLSNNRFETVTASSFQKAAEWEPGFKRTLNLADCRISHIEPLSFKQIPGLHDLDLSRNPGLPANNLTSVIKELETEGLERLSISGLNLTALEPFFTQVSRLSLKFLNASGNALEHVPASTFSTISSLQVLDLSGNKLTTLEAGFSELRNLKELNLSSNVMTSFKGDAVARLGNLELLDVSGNRLANSAEVTFGPLAKLTALDVHNNLMTSVVLPDTMPELKRCDYHANGVTQFSGFNSAPKLEYFDISDNDLEKVQAFLFKEAHYLKVVNFSKNSIAELDHRAFLPQSSLVIDLSHNFLTKLQYANWIATQELYLNHNDIAELDIQAFHRMGGLRVLDLSENKLGHINEDVLDHTNNLRHLNLSHNALDDTYFFLLFRNLMNLETLDVSSNNISHLNESMLLPLQKLRTFSIAQNRLEVVKPRVFRDLEEIESIDLSGNPFLCDCDNLGFQDWLVRTKIPIVGLHALNASGYACKGPPHRAGSHMNDWSPDQFECDRTMLYMIIFGSVGLTLIVAGVLSTIVFRVYKCHQRNKRMKEKERMERFYADEDLATKDGKLDLSRMTTEEIAEEITNAIERRERRSMRMSEKAEKAAAVAAMEGEIKIRNSNGYVAWPPEGKAKTVEKQDRESQEKKDKSKEKEKEKERVKGRQYERMMMMQQQQGDKCGSSEKKHSRDNRDVDNRDGRYPTTSKEDGDMKVHRPAAVKKAERGGGGYVYLDPEPADYGGYQTEPASRRMSGPHHHQPHHPHRGGGPSRWDTVDAWDREARGWVMPGHGQRRSKSQGHGHRRDDRYMTLPIREQDYHRHPNMHPRDRGRSSGRRNEPRMFLDHYTNEVRFGIEDLHRYPSNNDDNRKHRTSRRSSAPIHQQRSRSFHHLPQEYTGRRDNIDIHNMQPKPPAHYPSDRHVYHSDDDRRPLIGQQRAASQPYLVGENASDWL